MYIWIVNDLHKVKQTEYYTFRNVVHLKKNKDFLQIIYMWCLCDLSTFVTLNLNNMEYIPICFYFPFYVERCKLEADTRLCVLKRSVAPKFKRVIEHFSSEILSIRLYKNLYFSIWVNLYILKQSVDTSYNIK